MLPLDQVRTLLAVVDEGTFEAAARRLHVTPSAVSQRIKALEQGAGRVLLQRTKPVRLTESGSVVVRFGRQLTQVEQDLGGALGQADTGEPAQVAIAVNADSLATWFLPALSAAAERIPVCFDVQSADQDHTAELLRSGRVMAAVTSSAHPVQGCTARRLGRLRYHPIASPTFVDRHLADGPLRARLPHAPVVVFDRDDDLQDRYLGRLTRRRARGATRHYIPSSHMFVDAVARGLGWGMLPDLQAEPLLANGAIVHLDQEHAIDVPLYWQQWKLDSPALAVVAEEVAKAASRELRA